MREETSWAAAVVVRKDLTDEIFLCSTISYYKKYIEQMSTSTLLYNSLTLQSTVRVNTNRAYEVLSRLVQYEISQSEICLFCLR